MITTKQAKKMHRDANLDLSKPRTVFRAFVRGMPTSATTLAGEVEQELAPKLAQIRATGNKPKVLPGRSRQVSG